MIKNLYTEIAFFPVCSFSRSRYQSQKHLEMTDCTFVYTQMKLSLRSFYLTLDARPLKHARNAFHVSILRCSVTHLALKTS